MDCQTESEQGKRMRPKKKVVLVDSDEQRLSERAFVLRTHKYDVMACKSAQEAIALIASMPNWTLDAFIAELFLPDVNGNELCRLVKRSHPSIPTLLLCTKHKGDVHGLYADRFISKDAYTSSALLDRVRVMVAHKRGPKKKYPQPEAVIDQAGVPGVPARVA
jgi:DNA-binding response OmpR family regulator